MPTYHSETDYKAEPKSRFYPPQGMRPAAPMPQPVPDRSSSTAERIPDVPSVYAKKELRPYRQKKEDDAAYFAHRHPVSLQRLYEAADTLLNTYPRHGFIYDAYPDDLSLRLMRDRLLRENAGLTEEFLQAGCPITWLNLLTDTVLSECLLRLRKA